MTKILEAAIYIREGFKLYLGNAINTIIVDRMSVLVSLILRISDLLKMPGN